MCEDRKRFEETRLDPAPQAQAIPESVGYVGGLGSANMNAAGAGSDFRSAGWQDADRLAPAQQKRSPQSHQREAVAVIRLKQAQERRHALDIEIRDLRRVLELSSRYDIDVLAEYVQLISKHGL